MRLRFKNGRPLRPAQAVQKFNEEDGKLELLINSLKPEDAGDYSVKVINKLGESVQEAKVTVLEPQAKPKFLIPLSPVSAVEGSAVKFSVQVAGNPEPSVKWY